MVGNRAWFVGLFNSSGKRRQVSADKLFELTPLQVKLDKDD
jgi:ELMO domain-containing protein